MARLRLKVITANPYRMASDYYSNCQRGRDASARKQNKKNREKERKKKEWEREDWGGGGKASNMVPRSLVMVLSSQLQQLDCVVGYFVGNGCNEMLPNQGSGQIHF